MARIEYVNEDWTQMIERARQNPYFQAQYMRTFNSEEYEFVVIATNGSYVRGVSGSGDYTLEVSKQIRLGRLALDPKDVVCAFTRRQDGKIGAIVNRTKRITAIPSDLGALLGGRTSSLRKKDAAAQDSGKPKDQV